METKRQKARKKSDSETTQTTKEMQKPLYILIEKGAEFRH